ncbi:uncharacterized protein LOC109839239 [Asparagus officinalis]|uniref:uncharacterized protein LOC109839239 n=1 Tax=Asparagus officinalis TaxID=4686 RepID=UPI00098DFE61|nr:uncharacterized protein LOC109839239 [Asparagus officinalis]
MTIQEKLKLADFNQCQVPMEPRMKLRKTDASPSVDTFMYRSVVGSLRYLVNTRPDLAYFVGVVSRYMEAPTTTHMAVVKQILRYVRGTINHGCVYGIRKESETWLIRYSDSDLAGDVDDCKSTTGVIYFLGASPIIWVSRKQRVVALSSCETEYVATRQLLAKEFGWVA